MGAFHCKNYNVVEITTEILELCQYIPFMLSNVLIQSEHPGFIFFTDDGACNLCKIVVACSLLTYLAVRDKLLVFDRSYLRSWSIGLLFFLFLPKRSVNIALFSII